MKYRVINTVIECAELRNKPRNFKLAVQATRVDMEAITTSYSTDIDHWIKIPITKKDGQKGLVTLEVQRYLDVVLIKETLCTLSTQKVVGSSVQPS